ncbi:hypothetical protein MCHUDSM44219_03417 [Mycolicibacterium chubuense]|uniref:Uncharacterized protein n=1 Tax=Mycolicibacterium chubuense TaxID=1800 RepID=A0A0J6W6C9_MYCCU|nr:hypothetical protein MCHUDSM44219_03417 [Mycolicibacterium chubuense]
MQAIASLSALQFAQLVVEDHRLGRGRRVDVHDVGLLAADPQRTQHRHDRRDAASRRDEQQLFRWRIRQRELPLGGGQPDDRSRFDAADQMRGQESFGGRLDGDRDLALGLLGDRGERIRPPVPAAVDPQADADVLAGLVVPREAPARTDDHRRRVLGLRPDVDDLTAQFPRRPQRVEQRQVVVGQQGRRRAGSEPADHVDPAPGGRLDIPGRRLGPACHRLHQSGHGSPRSRR